MEAKSLLEAVAESTVLPQYKINAYLKRKKGLSLYFHEVSPAWKRGKTVKGTRGPWESFQGKSPDLQREPLQPDGRP